MGLTTIVDVVIGLVLVYFLMSVLCSGVNEFIAARTGRRGKFLREGLMRMLGDRWMYLRVIHHPPVASLHRSLSGRPRFPTYIEPENLSRAVVDVVMRKSAQIGGKVDAAMPPKNCKELRAAVLACQRHGYQLGNALLPLIDGAGDDLAAARRNIENWFGSTMDRVSGWYRRSTQNHLLVIGLILAVLFNVDSIAITKQLARSETLRSAIVATATQVTDPGAGGEPAAARPAASAEQLRALEQQGLPVGFTCMGDRANGAPAGGLGDLVSRCWNHAVAMTNGEWLLKLIGWLITGIAVGLGAPFWFDLIGRLVNLRGVGRKPVISGPTSEGTSAAR